MRIAVPSDNKIIAKSFEKSTEFTVFEVEDEKIVKQWYVYLSDKLNKSIFSIFKESRVNVLLCNSIGIDAKTKLRSMHLEIVTAVEGGVNEKVISYLSGENIGVMDIPSEETTFTDRMDTIIYRRNRRKFNIGGLKRGF